MVTKRPLKIAFITSMKYGLTQFMFRDIKALIEKGHEVQIFTLRNEKGLYNPLPEWDVVALSLWSLIWRQLWFLLRKPILYFRLLAMASRTGSWVNLAIAVSWVNKIRDCDIMLVYFGDHKLYTAFYCKQIAGIPLIASVRAYELYRNPNPAMFVRALRSCDRIVTITEHNRDLLVKKGIPAERIDIVRQIIDLEKFKWESKIKILIVGYFAEKKGHEVLFKALKKMNRADVELWVVGDLVPWIVGVDCRRLAREIGVESKVAFFGVQRDAALRALYRECDIFCLPSRPDRHGDREGFPNVIAEAMAFAKPVISTRHAGIPEVLDAILVDENNIEQLTYALERACDSAELRRELGSQNRVIAERLFSPANNDNLEEILFKYARPGSGSSLPSNKSLGQAEKLVGG